MINQFVQFTLHDFDLNRAKQWQKVDLIKNNNIDIVTSSQSKQRHSCCVLQFIFSQFQIFFYFYLSLFVLILWMKIYSFFSFNAIHIYKANEEKKEARMLFFYYCYSVVTVSWVNIQIKHLSRIYTSARQLYKFIKKPIFDENFQFSAI